MWYGMCFFQCLDLLDVQCLYLGMVDSEQHAAWLGPKQVSRRLREELARTRHVGLLAAEGVIVISVYLFGVA